MKHAPTKGGNTPEESENAAKNPASAGPIALAILPPNVFKPVQSMRACFGENSVPYPIYAPVSDVDLPFIVPRSDAVTVRFNATVCIETNEEVSYVRQRIKTGLNLTGLLRLTMLLKNAREKIRYTAITTVR